MESSLSASLAPIFPATLVVLGLGLLPFLVVMGTSFTKISIVLHLVRNALGLQGAPSGLVLNAIALTLTAFVMVPVVNDLIVSLQATHTDTSNWQGIVKTYEIVSKTYSGYLLKYTSKPELDFFTNAAKKMWPASMAPSITPDNLLILLPAHLASELTRAFQVAFILFLPFVIIDMVVSNILLAMGAMMVPPMLISLPIKLLLFVAINGWTLLLNNLVLSYAR